MSSFIFHVVFDCEDPEALASFWAAVTGYRRDERSTEDVVGLRAPDERGVRKLLFVKVPEPKATKNRMHVDLASKDPVAEAERLVALGATVVEARDGGLGASWTVMLDPEGNEFCLG